MIISSFPVQLGGKSISIEVEVVDAPLDYNLLLGRSWTYTMTIVISSVFQILCFPHEGRIVTIDQMDFNHSSSMVNQGSTVPWIENSQSKLRASVLECILHLWVPLIFHHRCPTFMPPRSATKSRVPQLLLQESFLSKHHIYKIHGCYPHHLIQVEGPHTCRDGYATVCSGSHLSSYTTSYYRLRSNSFFDEEDDLFPEPIWAQNSSNSQDCLDTIFPSDEAIIEEMTGAERPWEDMHHRSYFLPEISHVENGEFKSTVSRSVDQDGKSLG
jgi:hypothetical protein